MTDNDTIKTMMQRDGLTYTEAVAKMNGDDEDTPAGGPKFTGEQIETILALKTRLAVFAADLASGRFVYLLQALALAQKNEAAKDQKSILTIKIELTRDGEAYGWEGIASESYPATGKGELQSGRYDPNQPDLPGVEG
jgi:hypothetical protein